MAIKKSTTRKVSAKPTPRRVLKGSKHRAVPAAPVKKAKMKLKKAASSRKPDVIVPKIEKYFLNPDFEYYAELKSLVLKSSPAEKQDLTSKISRLGRVSLAIIAGVLINDDNPVPEIADLFMVADDIDRRKLQRFLKTLEASLGTEVKFALMDKEEFRYRYGMFDRFVRLLFEGPHEKLVNKLGV